MATKKVMIGFKADAEIKDKLEQIADIEDRSVSYIVNKFVVQGIEDYSEWKAKEGIRALNVVDYIENLKFSSYGEFIKITIEENTKNWIDEDLGALQAYMLVCDKLNIPADQRTIETIEMQEILKEDE